MNKETFEAFNHGELRLPNQTISFEQIPWSKHPVFEGVELKHIITSKDTDGEYSYHLVRIAPNKTQLETHEVIAGSGKCINNGSELIYEPGIISIMPAKIHHAVHAGEDGLYLFAKFFPALC